MINFCILNELIIVNKFFQYKDVHKYTKKVKNRNEKSIINYVLINKGNRTYVKDVRIKRGPETYGDHYLLRARISMKRREKGKAHT